MARSGQRAAGRPVSPVRSTGAADLAAAIGRPLTVEDEAAIARYRDIRDRELAKNEASDAAFRRYFTKLQTGEPTNGAATVRLENEANELSAQRWSAESALYKLEIDPDEIDKADGIRPLYRG